MLEETDEHVKLSQESIDRSGLGSHQETHGTPNINNAGDESLLTLTEPVRALSELPPKWAQEMVKQIVSEVHEVMESEMMQNLRDLSYALRVISHIAQDSQYSSRSQKDEEGSWSSDYKERSSGSWSGSGSSNKSPNPTPKTLPLPVRNALGIKIPSPQEGSIDARRPQVSSASGPSSRSGLASPRAASSSSGASPTVRKSDSSGAVLSPIQSATPSERSSVQEQPASGEREHMEATSPKPASGTSPKSLKGTSPKSSLSKERRCKDSSSPPGSLPPCVADAADEEDKDESVQLERGTSPQDLENDEEAKEPSPKLPLPKKLRKVDVVQHVDSSPMDGSSQGAADEDERLQAERGRSTAFQHFENSKEKNGNRTPCSLFDMEEDCLLMNLEHLGRRRKRSRKPRKREKKNPGQLSKILPDSSANEEHLEKVPENEITQRKDGEQKIPLNPSDKYESVDGDEVAYDSRALSSPGSCELEGKLKTRRSMDQLYNEHAKDIMNDYTGLQKHTSTEDMEENCQAKLDRWCAGFCGSRPLLRLKELPECCLVLFGITRPGNGLWSRIYFFSALVFKFGLVSYVVVQDFSKAMEFDQVYYTSLMHALVAIGALVSTLCLWEGRAGALLGGQCDAIKMYAQANFFLDAWRTKSFTYFCSIGILWAAQTVMLLYEVPGADSEECRDGGLRDFSSTKLAAHILLVATMSMLAFLHFRMCAGLQLMVDSFCEDFQMGMDEIQAASKWNLIDSLMSRTTSTIGTCFLAQISTFSAALVCAGADVLVGNVGLDSACCIPWLVNWLIPTLLSFFVAYLGLIECGRLSLKCSRVAGFVNTMRYQQVTQNEATRNLRQYLTSFIHQTSSGFLIQGVRMTTFVAFKIGWALVTIAFAIWARSRST